MCGLPGVEVMTTVISLFDELECALSAGTNAERMSLSEAVTDVLVARGNDRVVHSLARNDGARFSFAGLHMLVRRSSDDDALAMEVGMRSDLPRQHMLRLLDRASAAVRDRLLTENPGSCEAVESAVKEVPGNIRSDLHQS